MGLVYEWAGAKLYLDYPNLLQPTLNFLLSCFTAFAKLRLLSLKALCEVCLYCKSQFG